MHLSINEFFIQWAQTTTTEVKYIFYVKEPVGYYEENLVQTTLFLG